MEKYAPQAGTQSLGKGAIKQKKRESGISRGSEKQEGCLKPFREIQNIESTGD